MVGKDLLDTPVTELMTDFFAKYTKLWAVHLGPKGNCRTQIMRLAVPHPSTTVSEASFKIIGVGLWRSKSIFEIPDWNS